MKTLDPEVALLLAKTLTLRAAGLNEKQCISIREYEFSFKDGQIEYLETWSNTQRTKGNKKYTVAEAVGKMLLDAWKR
jgi:hypothetical protein